jgi:hypothetical protein
VRVEFTIRLDDFEDLTLQQQQDVYLDALQAVVNANVAWLRFDSRYRTVPTLYASGVRFAISAAERQGRGNVGPNIPAILKVGTAHCVGLSCWRIADLRVRDGVDAVPCVQTFRADEPGVGFVDEFHVCVQMPDGSVEDPSRELGMTT